MAGRLARALGRLAVAVIRFAIIAPLAWWTVRKLRRATRELRREIARCAPFVTTASGVPIVPRAHVPAPSPASPHS